MMEPVFFPNIGFLKVRLTDQQLEPILKEVEKICQNYDISVEANADLAGHIKKEYILTDCLEQIDSILYEHVQQFENCFNFLTKYYKTLSESKPLIISKSWVNFQEKYEFNPVHDHAGILSFVIWLKIPFLMENETAQSPGSKSNNPLSGCFNFHYTDSLGQICNYTIPADQTMENTLLIFPARMPHSVYPFFTSDGYRISVSGNIIFKV